MEKKICIVVPTYPMHYLYALDLMKSFEEFYYDKQASLYFVFTTPEERDGFMPCNSIVLPKSLRTQSRGIINIKKFYALTQLKEKYEYIIVIDDESLFCRTVDLYDFCSSFFCQKILYGNLIENAPWDFFNAVTESCGKVFKKDAKKLRSPLWLWYNQIPIYRTADLKDFFKTTGLGKRINSLTYNDFDYYYYYYLILKFDFCTVDIGITADGAAVETTEGSFFKINGNYEREHIYMSTRFAKDLFHFDNVFLLCHIDREKTQRKHQGKISQLFKAFKTYFEIKKILS